MKNQAVVMDEVAEIRRREGQRRTLATLDALNAPNLVEARVAFPTPAHPGRAFSFDEMFGGPDDTLDE